MKPNVYITSYGRAFMADSAAELVTMIHMDSFDRCATDTIFMQRVAKRIFDEDGIVIPTDDADAFIAGLMKAGRIEREDNGLQNRGTKPKLKKDEGWSD